MDDLVKSYYLREYLRRKGKHEANVAGPIVQRTYPYIQGLFDKQLSVRADPNKFKAVLCGRRAGKSYGICACMIETCESRNDAQCLYLALTRPAAKRIMWRTLKHMNRKYDLKIHFDNIDLTATFPNNSQIYLAGANNAGEIEKFRGSHFDHVAIDEAGAFGEHLQELVEDVIEPTLIDRDGELWLVGNPNARCAGYFHDVTNGVKEGYSLHHWTILDNPTIPHAREWLENRLRKRNWTWDHPVFQREWLGRWVRDITSMVYRYKAERNLLVTDWKPTHHIIGVDLGYEDATAFIVWGFDLKSPRVRAVDCFKKVGMLPHEVAISLKTYIDKYKPVKVKADTGGLGKAIVEEMKSRYGLMIEPAEKQKKHDFIELMNSDFEMGLIEIDPENTELKNYVSELSTLQWDEKRRKEDPRYENHCCDGGLYGWREAKHWTYKPPASKISPNSNEFMSIQEEKDAEALDRELRAEKEWNDV